MVPRRPRHHKLSAALASLVATRRVWVAGLLVWLVAVALPYAFLYPGQGLDRPVCLALAGIAPVGMLIAALSGGAPVVLGVGLSGLAPIYIASPELLGERTTGALQGVVLAVLILIFVAAGFDDPSSREPAREHTSPADGHLAVRLRSLLSPPSTLADGMLVALGAVWLALAWFGVGDTDMGARARTTRLAAAALCWIAVRLIGVGGRGVLTDSSHPLVLLASRREDRWQALLARRLIWLAVLGAGAWSWLR